MVTSRNAVAFVNIHPQKSKWVTAKIILVSPASILVGEWLQRQRHIGAWPLYILFKCDVRHRLHCFVCTDTHLFIFTKGKTDIVNQRWRRTTCLQHQCYDVGCYPWSLHPRNVAKCSTNVRRRFSMSLYILIHWTEVMSGHLFCTCSESKKSLLQNFNSTKKQGFVKTENYVISKWLVDLAQTKSK